MVHPGQPSPAALYVKQATYQAAFQQSATISPAYWHGLTNQAYSKRALQTLAQHTESEEH